MKPKTTFILLGICIVGVVAVLLERKYGKTTEEWEKYEKKIFPDFKDKLVNKIEIHHNSSKITCLKKENKWFLESPISDRADSSTIDSILSELEWMERVGKPITSEPAKPLKLSEYGLDKPRAKLTFHTSTGKRSISIGGYAIGTAGLKDNVYIYLDDDKSTVLVTDDTIYDKITKELKDFRSKDVVEINKDKVSKIELVLQEKRVLCEKKDKIWRLLSPVEDRADPDTLKEIVDKIDELKKESFVRDNVKDFSEWGLDKPAYKIALWTGAQQASVEILLGKKTDSRLYAMTRGTPSIYTVKDDILDKIDKDLKEFRDPKLERFTKDDVTQISIECEDKSVLLHRDNEDQDWKMTKPEEMEADDDEGDDFLDDLSDLDIEDWVEDKPKDLAKYGLDKPWATITLTEGGKVKEENGKKTQPTPSTQKTIIIGKSKDDKTRYAKRKDEPNIFLVKSEDLKALPKGYLAFISKEIFDFSTSDVKKITLERDGKLLIAKREEDSWNLLSPVKAKADKSNIDDILWDLDDLEAEEMVSTDTSKLKDYGLEKPSVKITLLLEEEQEEEKKKVEKELTLLVGKKTDDDNYYALDKNGKYNGKYIFTIADYIYDDLKEELKDRTIADFSASDATQLILTYPDLKIVCEKKDDKWTIKEPPDKKADSSKIKDIIDTLHDLKCERYVQYQARDLAKYGLDKPQLTVTCKVEDKEELLLHIGKQEDDNFYCRKGDSREVFILDKSTAEDIMKKLKDITKKEKKEVKE